MSLQPGETCPTCCEHKMTREEIDAEIVRLRVKVNGMTKHIVSAKFSRGDGTEYLTLQGGSVGHILLLTQTLLEQHKVSLFQGGDRVLIVNGNETIQDYKLCFSCDVSPIKYIDGLCQTCHDIAIKDEP